MMKQKQLINSLLLFISMALWGTRMYAQEAYAVLTDIDEYGKKELTFYYDDLKAARNGMDIGPFSSEAERGWGSVVSSVSKVIFNHLQSIEGIENV
jgi:hypothetical protein